MDPRRNISAYDTPLERGPSGKALCRWCKSEVLDPRRRTFCSRPCFDEWTIRSSPSFARRRVFERDQGVCKQCGLDTRRLEAEARVLAWDKLAEPDQVHTDEAGRRWLLRRVGPGHVTVNGLYVPLDRTLWQADHIVEVADGGGACGLDNLQTLCWRCHPQKSGASARARNQKRRGR